MDTRDLQILTLGVKNSNADKSITWDQPFPNFNEQDVLIIDLNSLTDEVFERIDKSKFLEARNQIFNKFVNGGTIIFITAPYRRFDAKGNNNTKQKKHRSKDTNITSKVKIINPPIYSNYSLSPIEFATTNVIEGKRIKYPQQNEFVSSYLSKISGFSYYLHNFEISSSFVEMKPTNNMMSMIVESLIRQSDNNLRNPEDLELVTKNLASDNSNNTISVECWLKVDGYWESGKSIYLPPHTNGVEVKARDFETGQVFIDKYKYSFYCYDTNDPDFTNLLIWQCAMTEAYKVLNYLSKNETILEVTRNGRPRSKLITYQINPPLDQ